MRYLTFKDSMHPRAMDALSLENRVKASAKPKARASEPSLPKAAAKPVPKPKAADTAVAKPKTRVRGKHSE